MPADTHSVKAQVASDGPSEVTAAPEQSDAQKTSQAKDTRTLFEEASKLVFSSTTEENLERCPILKQFPPRSVSPATAFRVLEELERKERELPDPTLDDEASVGNGS